MNQTLYFIIACSLLFAVNLNAQNQFHKCVSAEAEKAMEVNNPGYLQSIKSAFQKAKSNANIRVSQRGNMLDTIYRIRTVFHVVYSKPEENLDDSVILSQLDVINEDFRRKNADTVNTRSIFSSFAADAGIEFFLADTDPDGNPTNGIIHSVGTPSGGIFGGFGASDEVKKTSTGGVNPWPTDKYLNIWICDLMGGIGVLGYSYPPADSLANWGSNNPKADSAVQGVVLYYKAVGRNNPSPIDPSVDGGRSATHEIGHFLGLRHIWGDDQPMFGQGNKCAGDVDGGSDGIDDTPDATDASQQTCDTTKNTCPDPNLSQDYPDMVENYMDYSSDDCLNMFTNEQVALMREVIKLYRPGIAEVVVNTSSSIKQIGNLEMVKVSPNPTQGFVYVELPSSTEGKIELNLISTEGKLVRSFESSTKATRLDLDEIQQGVYLLSVKNRNLSTVKRIVIAE
ncbi:MAG TPA: M43 family zinc metalloprotease [Chitinophagales bacterium]|nr:M43 family zinc metalloprotease [Chitinophagales bacterium]HRP38541.1 M43 family zinc metalloprotease [Chitinophagales bacterium]